MRFFEKLPKLRKNNNFSQEQLADKLGVSRQAVSKWEIGSSYPDMDKMLQMCKILNCNLEDLMDDGVLGENTSNQKSNKLTFNMYMKDFLNFITKSYNMFCSMKFKEKLKFIFEMSCISVVLLIIGVIIYSILEWFILDITGYSTIGWVISDTVTSAFAIILAIIGLIILLHLFKIRYLDYFITIEDQNVLEKTIEEPIEKKENKYYQEKPKEKIIIRDAKHSAFSFFDVLGKVILFMVKASTILFILPVIALFIFLICCIIISLYHISYSIIFLWIVLLFLGLNLLAYLLIEWVYNFITAGKQHIKRIFILSIVGLSLMGIGIGLSICTYMSYDKVYDFEDESYLSKVINLSIEDNTIFHYNAFGYEYIVDEEISDIQVEIKYLNINDFSISMFNIHGYEEYYIQNNFDFFNTYKLILNDFKNKKIRDYDNAMNIKVIVTASQETYDRLQENYKKFSKKIEEMNYYDSYDIIYSDFML